MLRNIAKNRHGHDPYGAARLAIEANGNKSMADRIEERYKDHLEKQPDKQTVSPRWRAREIQTGALQTSS